MQNRKNALAALAIAFVIAACGRDEPPRPGADSANAGEAAPAAVGGMETKLTKDQVSVVLTESGAAKYDAAKDTLSINVKIANNGKADLVSAGTYPINLAPVMISSELGPNKMPIRRDLVRVKIPTVKSGESKDVVVNLKGADVATGEKLNLELVQERNAWFSYDFKQPALILGPFSRCNGADKTMCNADGTTVGP